MKCPEKLNLSLIFWELTGIICWMICLNRAEMKNYFQIHEKRPQVDYEMPTNYNNTCNTYTKELHISKKA